jgi:hypothetical protein
MARKFHAFLTLPPEDPDGQALTHRRVAPWRASRTIAGVLTGSWILHCARLCRANQYRGFCTGIRRSMVQGAAVINHGIFARRCERCRTLVGVEGIANPDQLAIVSWSYMAGMRFSGRWSILIFTRRWSPLRLTIRFLRDAAPRHIISVSR